MNDYIEGRASSLADIARREGKVERRIGKLAPSLSPSPTAVHTPTSLTMPNG